jgi:hypothetical protein
MRIDMYDDHAVQQPDNSADDVFEAGWGPAGAVCTEEVARAHGAILFNRSKP